MKIYKIYDNGGKTWDRYTLLTEPCCVGGSCECNAYGFSENAKSPQGFNQYGGKTYVGTDMGKEIAFDKLPQDVQEAILDRLK